MAALLSKYKDRPAWVAEWTRTYQELRAHSPGRLHAFLSSLRWEHLWEESRKLDKIPHYTR